MTSMKKWSLSKQDKKLVAMALANKEWAWLTKREDKILSLRFDADGNRQRTLYQVGELFNITGNRISQIEARALEKLRTCDARAAMRKRILGV
jgi:DNA-directed RNA polymerase sigma subunit (sigma70/sigma32)